MKPIDFRLNMTEEELENQNYIAQILILTLPVDIFANGTSLFFSGAKFEAYVLMLRLKVSTRSNLKKDLGVEALL